MSRAFVLGSILVSLSLVGCRDKGDDDNINNVGDEGIDADGDGYSADEDCDDDNAAVHPGASEVCNGIDDDCSGAVDDGAGDTWYADADGDGYGDPALSTTDCDGATGYVDNGDDCDDTDASINPESEWYDDGDGDGYGDPTDVTQSCEQPSDTVSNSEDCNDGRSDVNPDGTEVCDDIDNDCDGEVDEDDAADAATWHVDADGDGYGDPDTGVLGCDAPSGSVEDGSDCNDDDASIHPDARDTWYDGVDSDCAGDDDYDRDGDGYSSDSYGGDDCDDADYDIHPDASDTWYDGVDADCAGNSDHDADGDTYDSDVYGGEDCDDTRSDVYPGADESDGKVDNDCDGDVEEMPVADASYDSSASLETCTLIQLDGSGSYDPDGTSLTFDWELTSAPTSSSRTTSDIEDPDDESPDFYPDVAGTYAFTLSVTDGGDTTSTPDALSLTVTTRTDNNEPVADAGDDSTEADSVTCSPISYGVSYSCAVCDDTRVALRGTGSYDDDDEPLTYAWSVVSGTATIDDDTARSTTATISYTEAVTYGATSSEDVVIQLEVTDCFGDSSTDTVTITLECTGE